MIYSALTGCCSIQSGNYSLFKFIIEMASQDAAQNWGFILGLQEKPEHMVSL